MLSLVALCMLGGSSMKISTQDIVARSWKKTGVVGHRGAAAYEPENTLPAFEKGIECKADAVECDVHTSRDGDLVVMHDSTLDRTTKLKGPVKDVSTATLREAGIPFLPDLTALTKDRVVLIVEIKDGDDVDRKVVDHLKERKMVEQTIVFSFGDQHVANVKKLNPEQFGVWLVGQKIDPANMTPVFDKLKEIKADALGVDYHNCPAELVEEAHRRHLPIFVWTVPPGAEVDRLKALKVNFIITNHPRDVRSQLEATGG